MTQRRPVQPEDVATSRRWRRWGWRVLIGGAIALGLGGALLVLAFVTTLFTACGWIDSCSENGERLYYLLAYPGLFLGGLGVVGLVVALVLFVRSLLAPQVPPL